MEVTGALNKSRLSVGWRPKFSYSRLGGDCEMRTINKSSGCNGEQKNGVVATGRCGGQGSELLFLSLRDMKTCV